MARYNQSIKETKGKTLDKKKVEYKGIPDPRQPITTVQPRRVVTQQTVQPVVQQAAEAQYVQSSISVIKNLPYLVNTSTTNYVKLFDSSIDLVLQDVLIINRSATEVAAVNILLSEFDIDTESGKNLNKQLEDHKSTVYLLDGYDLRANTSLVSDQATSNQTTLREAAMLGDVNFSSKLKTIYLYAHKPTNLGTVDMTIIK